MVAVAKPADTALPVVEAGVLLAVRRVRAVALELRDIGVRHEFAVQDHLNAAADHAHLLEVPHAGPAHVAAAAGEVLVLAPDLLVEVVALRRHDAVDRPRVLVGPELVLLRGLVVVGVTAVVEQLEFAHRVIGGVLVDVGHAQAESVVAVLGHAELEAEDEVLELLLRAEVAAGALARLAGEDVHLLHLARPGHLDLDRLDAVGRRGADPAREVLAVEQRHEPFGVGHRRAEGHAGRQRGRREETAFHGFSCSFCLCLRRGCWTACGSRS